MVGAGILLIGLILQITKFAFSPYIFLVGAIMFGYVQVMSRYDGSSFVIKRLRRQQILASILLAFTGILMLLFNHNEWILSLTISAFLELYTIFRISKELEKENK